MAKVSLANESATLVTVAAAEAANKVSYTEGDGGSRVWPLLYGCAKEVLSPPSAFADSLGSIGRRLLRLPVRILQRPLHLLPLALELAFYVAGLTFGGLHSTPRCRNPGTNADEYLEVSAVLTDGESVDKLIRALTATKALLPEKVTSQPEDDEAAN